MKKKFLSLLTILVVIIFALALLACEKYEQEEEETIEEAYTPSYSHTIVNGTFYNAKSSATSASSSNAKLILDNLKMKTDSSSSDTDTWTFGGRGIATSTSGANGILNAAIDLSDETAFKTVADAYLTITKEAAEEGAQAETITIANPGVDPMTPLVKAYDEKGETLYYDAEKQNPKLIPEDTNALVLASTEKQTSVYATSSSFTLKANTHYLLQFSVCTKIDNGGDENKGAWFRLKGDNMRYEVGSIDTNNEWETYYLFIETNKNGDMTASVELGLGFGPYTYVKDDEHTSTTYPDDNKDIYATRGIALFDNVICEEIEFDATVTKAVENAAKKSLGAYKKDAEGYYVVNADYAYTPVATYEGFEYDGEKLIPDNFTTFKANIHSEKDGKDNKYVAAKSSYYLVNADMQARAEVESGSYQDSYRRYYYSFREYSGNSNLKGYSFDGNNTSAKYYGIVDLSKLYTVPAEGAEAPTKDNYSSIVNTSSTADWNEKFYPTSYANWYNYVMNYDGTEGAYDLSSAEDTFALMIYNRDLSQNKISTANSIYIDPDTYYEISVWAYVWAEKYTHEDSTEHYYGESKFSGKDPRGTSGSFSVSDKLLYNLILNLNDSDDDVTVGEGDDAYVQSNAFKGFTGMTAEEKVEQSAYEAALGRIQDLGYVYDGTAENIATFKNAAKTWTRSYLKAASDIYTDTNPSASNLEAFAKTLYFIFLDSRVNGATNAYESTFNTDSLKQDVATVAAYVRSNIIDDYNKLVEKVETYEKEKSDWEASNVGVLAKYAAWESANYIDGTNVVLPKATISITGAGDVADKKTTKFNEWEKITFKVQGNQLTQRKVTLEMAMGTGNDETTYMIGGAFFDNIEIKEYKTVDDPESYTRLSGINDEDSELKFGDLAKEAGTGVPDNEDGKIWKAETATGTASSDKANVEVTTSEVKETIKVGNNDVDLYAVTLNNKVATASTLYYKGENVIEVLPNKYYRFAFLMKTEDVDESLGVNVTIKYSKNADFSDAKTNTTVSAYTTDGEWKEIAYYIQGDQFDKYYLTLEVSMGSGTKRDTSKYVKGSVSIAAFNCVSITATEYSATAKSGDKTASISIYSTASRDIESGTYFTNPSYEDIERGTSGTSEDQFDENGNLTGIGKTQSWTSVSVADNEYNKPTGVVLDKENNKLKWTPVKGYSGINGVFAEVDPVSYEIWIKYTIDGKETKKLYAIVAGGTTEYEDPAAATKVAIKHEFDLSAFAAANAEKAATYFAVKAIGQDGVSDLSSFTSDYIGKDTTTDEEPTGATEESEASVKAGTVVLTDALKTELFGQTNFDGVNYVSVYPTFMKLTSNYDSTFGIKSSSATLSKNGYYRISLWAKTIGATKASIILTDTSGSLNATTNGSELGFVNINTAGEWVQYNFYISTGINDAKVTIQYSIGNPYAKAITGTIGAGDKQTYYPAAQLSQGTVYFDAVSISTLTEEKFTTVKALDAAKAEEVAYANVKEVSGDLLFNDYDKLAYVMEYVVDSFDSSKVSTTTEKDNNKKGNEPYNYTIVRDTDLETDGMYSVYGVYDYTSTDENMRRALANLYSYHVDDSSSTANDARDVYVFEEAFKQMYAGVADWAGLGLVQGDNESDEDYKARYWDEFIKAFLKINREDEEGNVVYEGGNSVLVLSNKKESGFAQWYSSGNSYEAKAGSYTKITFSARAIVGTVSVASEEKDDDGNVVKTTYAYSKDNAFGEFRLTTSSANEDVEHMKINSEVYGNGIYDDVTYTYYLYNPTSSANKVTWAFHLGGEKNKTDNWYEQYVIGIMAIDLVSAEDVTKEEYEEAVAAIKASGDQTKASAYFEYPEEEKKDDDNNGEGDNKDDEEEDTEKESFWDRIFKSGIYWLYISSFVIALVIIITVVVVLVRKWKKKHPKEEVVENVVKTEKDIKVIPTQPKEKEEALEADEYVDEIKPVYVQRVNKNKSRKDRKSK